LQTVAFGLGLIPVTLHACVVYPQLVALGNRGAVGRGKDSIGLMLIGPFVCDPQCFLDFLIRRHVRTPLSVWFRRPDLPA